MAFLTCSIITRVAGDRQLYRVHDRRADVHGVYTGAADIDLLD